MTEADIEGFRLWQMDGGDITAKQFFGLSDKEQAAVLAYLRKAPVFEVLEEADRKYILTHAGISGFAGEKDLSEYDMTDFLFERADYGKRYFLDENIYLVTGHTPTETIRADKQPLVYQEKGHIALDCGCVYGGQLAAYCVETKRVTYVSTRIKAAWEGFLWKD